MKPLVLSVLFCLLASTTVVATFETEDPLQEIEDLRAAKYFDNVKVDPGVVSLAKKDYLRLIVSSYVNGFKEFDTTVETSENSVSVSILYDSDQQDQERVDQIANRFREEIPPMLKSYPWAKNVSIGVTVHDVADLNRQK